MEIEKVELQIMTASEGKWLTQVEESTPISSRVLSKKVYLGVNDYAENYAEIDDETKAAYDKAKQADADAGAEAEAPKNE